MKNICHFINLYLKIRSLNYTNMKLMERALRITYVIILKYKELFMMLRFRGLRMLIHIDLNIFDYCKSQKST